MEFGVGAIARVLQSGAVARAIGSATGDFATEGSEEHVEYGERALVVGKPDEQGELPCLVGDRTVWVPCGWLTLERPPATKWRRPPATPAVGDDGLDRSIHQYVGAAASNLAQDLAQFWPATGNNEMAEANLVFQLGSVLRSRRFRVYAEVPVLGEARGHLDLLAFNERLTLGIEAKRLYHHDKAHELARDYWRLATGLVPSAQGAQGIPASERTAILLIATTWQPGVREWWTSDDRGTAPGTGDGWAALSEALRDVGSQRVGAYRLQKDVGGWGTHWLLFAWKDRERSFNDTTATS